MTLEDSVGDIVSKARNSLQMTVDEAADAAELSATSYSEFERTGKAPAGCNWAKLASRLTLDGTKLAGIAQGWLPPAVDLALWREIRAFSSTEDGTTVNCYLVWDEVNREAALFDTGFDATPILACIQENDLQLRHFFLTHSHPDHLAALPSIRERHPKVRLHSNSKNAPVEQRNRANDFIMLGSLRITNRETPGHSEDGVTYVVGNWPEDAPHTAIVGDALFAGSMGGAREHLELARKKVREQIFTLPAETLICPGHGPLTTVALEKSHNPWFP